MRTICTRMCSTVILWSGFIGTVPLRSILSWNNNITPGIQNITQSSQLDEAKSPEIPGKSGDYHSSRQDRQAFLNKGVHLLANSQTACFGILLGGREDPDQAGLDGPCCQNGRQEKIDEGIFEPR